MDAKTAVKILRESVELVIINPWKVIIPTETELIADFIEQQEKEIAGLTDDNGQQHIEIMLLTRKNKEQEKYAELGRITDEIIKDWANSRMTPMEFIGKLRVKYAELLGEGRD